MRRQRNADDSIAQHSSLLLPLAIHVRILHHRATLLRGRAFPWPRRVVHSPWVIPQWCSDLPGTFLPGTRCLPHDVRRTNSPTLQSRNQLTTQ